MLLRLFILAAVLLSIGSASQSVLTDGRCDAPGLTQPEVGAQSQASRYILRKLHLVRPDLIPYPLNYEVVC